MGHRKCLPTVCDRGSFWREHPTGLVFCGATWEQGPKVSYEMTVLFQVLAGTGSLTSVNCGPHVAQKLRHRLVCLDRWRRQAPRQEPPAQGLSGRQSQDPQQLLCFPSPELKRQPPQCPVRTLTCTASTKAPRTSLCFSASPTILNDWCLANQWLPSRSMRSTRSSLVLVGGRYSGLSRRGPVPPGRGGGNLGKFWRDV